MSRNDSELRTVLQLALIETGPDLLAEIATEGCEQLSRRLLAATESAWRGKAAE